MHTKKTKVQTENILIKQMKDKDKRQMEKEVVQMLRFVTWLCTVEL